VGPLSFSAVISSAALLRAPLPVSAPAEVSAPRDLTVTVESQLATHLAAWEDLIAHVVAPNPFYEPDALLAALAHLPEASQVEVVCVWAANPLPKQPAILVGLFPLLREPTYKGLPLPTLRTWKHLYSYQGTPLVRANHSSKVLDAFLDWLPSSGASLFVWDTIVSDTGFRHALTDALQRRQLPTFEDERHTRALFRAAKDADSFIARAIGGKKQKELRRQLRRLNDLEPVTFERCTDLERWIELYFALEARGWKGGHGTALKDDPHASAMFRALLRGAHARGRLDLWMMTQPSRPLPIAMKCNLRSGESAIAFKISYDEELAKFSPACCSRWSTSPGCTNQALHRGSIPVPRHAIR
jgi:CelD/BcsL family acetyltransferase involved in cellulose biosynthesis